MKRTFSKGTFVVVVGALFALWAATLLPEVNLRQPLNPSLDSKTSGEEPMILGEDVEGVRKAAPSALSEDPQAQVTGTLKVMDGFQEAPRTPSFARLVLSDGRQVLVRDGEWSFAVGGQAMPEPLQVLEEGRTLAILRRPIGVEPENHLVAFGFPGFFVSAESSSGGTVQGFKVLQERNPSPKPYPPHPGSIWHCKTLVESGSGWHFLPVNGPGARDYLITAANLTWARIPAGVLHPGEEHVVKLSPAGAVEFGLANVSARRDLRIIMQQEPLGHSPIQYSVHEELQPLLQGVPPGRYSCFLAMDSNGLRSEAVSNIVPLEVQAGGTSRAELRMKSLVPEELWGELEVHVTLRAIELWREVAGAQEELQMKIVPSGDAPTFQTLAISKKSQRLLALDLLDMAQGVQESETRLWDIGSFPPGDYKLGIYPLGQTWSFRVEADKRTTVDAQVLEPGVLHLHVSQGGTPVSGAQIMREAFMEGVAYKGSAKTDQAGELSLVVAPGEVPLVLTHSVYGVQEKAFDVKPGWNGENWELGAQYSARLRMTSETGAALPMTMALLLALEFEPIDGAGVCTLRGRGKPLSSQCAHLTFSEPGEYRVTLNASAQWQLATPQSLRVQAGAPSDYTMAVIAAEEPNDSEK